MGREQMGDLDMTGKESRIKTATPDEVARYAASSDDVVRPADAAVPPADVAAGTSEADDESQRLRDKLKECQDRHRRALAEIQNVTRRLNDERSQAVRFAVADFVRDLLPVLDNFERAIGASGSSIGPGFRDGIALIFRQLLEELRKEGLVAVDTVGEPFDPTLHEAVATTHDPDLPPHTIVEELQRGYLLHQRLLRPALVRVTVDPEPQGGVARERGER